ncbi:hypothetical protein MVLG_02485 [Microbotryum lychnidis-dioicae p1A1 Lamole]|uniref:Uncharacterized protein n=1 Tax=Microbotryum lychnidis-dioicae (strain p1A1 Lamole / MvSl-1064) TaxID=683840 RepID=U5H5B0_USTV1|nr:hypothetical protein MVLG_02485 [Microbotryum lychnidis-dioicae p1A1 Lamole]|eukprot:KDE07265.1 hypothetical protein MVLG_02485 [Microbotryum lychnidis-dioicae p1A1 Lamole]
MILDISSPQSNIFSIAFSCDDRKLFCAGNDHNVRMYDLEAHPPSRSNETERGHRASRMWEAHDDAVHRVRCHPMNPDLFMSASDDGILNSYDLRVPGGRVNVGVVNVLGDPTAELCDVAYHPQQPDTLFATANSRGALLLHDTRMTTSPTYLLTKTFAVQEFHSNLIRYVSGSNTTASVETASPSISSISFSPNGSLLSATLTGYLPTFYEISSPLPLFTVSSPPPPATEVTSSSRTLEDTIPMYRNGVTVKHGGFGGDESGGGALRYAEGSDDFRVYVWDLPKSYEDFKAQRKTWQEGEQMPEGVDDAQARVAFRGSNPDSSRTIVPSISIPSSILDPHRSIVNSCLFHPTLPLLFTSGVEKTIWAHSPYPFSESIYPVPRTRRKPNPVVSWLAMMSPVFERVVENESQEEKERRLRAEDREVLEYFDAIAIGDREIWRSAKLGSNEEEEEEDDDDDEEEDEEEEEDSEEEFADELAHSEEDADEDLEEQLVVQDSDSGVDPDEYP